MSDQNSQKIIPSQFSIRIAEPSDGEAVSTLLEISYSHLLANSYDKDLLHLALPNMIKANLTLLASGTYYVAESKDGILIGCGGWTPEKPGSKEVVVGEGHIRHFATHPNWARRGVGAAILTRCIADAKSSSIHTVHCFSTLNAESFYQRSGFRTVKLMNVPMGPGIMFPAVLMELALLNNQG